MSVTEMNMSRKINDKPRKYRIRNEYIIAN